MVFSTSGIQFEIREVPNVIEALRSIFGNKMGFRGELHGITLQEHSLILVGRDQSEPQRARTILHEATHAIMPAMNERSVRKLEDGLFPLIRRCGFAYPEDLLRRDQ